MYKDISTEQLRCIIASQLERISKLEKKTFSLQFGATVDSCDGASRTVCFRIRTSAWMMNADGVVHGGILATMMDYAMGTLCFCLYGANTAVPTVSLALNYARPVPVETDVIVRARPITTGKTNAQLVAELYLPDKCDSILVTAQGVFHTGRFKQV